MANVESTGFTKLIRDLTRRPVDRESDDDVLFTDPDAAPRRMNTARAFEVVLPKSLDDAVTLRVRRQPDRLELAKLALPFGLLAVLGVLIGLAITTKSKREAPTTASAATATQTAAAAPPASAPPAAPTPAPASTTPAAPPAPAPSVPTITPAATLAPVTPAPKLVEVRLESTPPGANVTMVDDGKVSVLGRTPIDASLDPSHKYEVVFALDAYTTRVEHVDPSKTANVAVVLGALPAKPARTSHATRHRSKHH